MSAEMFIEHPWKDQIFVKLSKAELQSVLDSLGNAADEVLITKLKDGLSYIKTKKQPTVFDRLDELDFTGGNIHLDGVADFSYSWHDPDGTKAGYEKLDSTNVLNEKGQAGGHHYSGVYHPDVICETIHGDGPGICKHCGITLF
jgi:hypothetical protein